MPYDIPFLPDCKKKTIYNTFIFNKICFGFLLTLIFSSCIPSNDIVIIIDENATKIELLTADDLKSDIEKVTGKTANIHIGKISSGSRVQYYLGNAKSSHIKKIVDESDAKIDIEYPGQRGGIIHKVGSNTILLLGSDFQGMQYAVYDYSKSTLGIDPLSYWSGHKPNKLQLQDLLTFENLIVHPPKVPLIGYFENDADELMNLKKPLLTYDWESFTEMINALVRMKYNVFHFFDALGRSEFYLRKEYQDMVPNYQIDMDYVEKMIDYVQDKGMLVQVDLSMGYQDKSLESEFADCWSEHKDKWKEVWNYYLKETAFGKADIFSLRPRNQVWDWEYKSVCGEEKIPVFNEVFKELGGIITSHNPEARKVVVCYSDAMNMFNEGFAPPEDWIVAWSDDGYGSFKVLPESTKGYSFGTYMHAGFWKNHTVSHPYPPIVDSVMHMMFDKYDATAYCLVNGQQFRPFILNLEAYSEICINPDEFSASTFYKKWASRYFEPRFHDEIINLMESWDKSSFGQAGYVQNLWEIKEAIAYLREKDLERPGRSSVKYEASRVENDLDAVVKRQEMIKENLDKAEEILVNMNNENTYFFDQIYHPLLIYNDLLTFELKLHELYRIKRRLEEKENKELSSEARVRIEELKILLKNIYTNSMLDSADPKWNGWYDPEVRRPNNGFPTMEMLEDIEKLFNSKY